MYHVVTYRGTFLCRDPHWPQDAMFWAGWAYQWHTGPGRAERFAGVADAVRWLVDNDLPGLVVPAV